MTGSRAPASLPFAKAPAHTAGARRVRIGKPRPAGREHRL